MPVVNADMPIMDVSLSFNSLSELNDFYEKNKFGVVKYSSALWDFSVEIDKSKIYNPHKTYVIAPYDYFDKSGYPHKIPRDGCFISLNNIEDNITVIITGFKRATVVVHNFGGTVVFGKYVSLQKKMKHEGWRFDWGYLIPVYNFYLAATDIQKAISAIGNLAPAEYMGMVDSTVTVTNANRVIFTNFFVESSISEPILVNNVRKVKMNGVFIAPSPYSTIDGAAVKLTNVDNVVISGNNEISRYRYNLALRDVKNFILSGMLTFNGSYKDPRTEIFSKYGVGVYADSVNRTIIGINHIRAEIGEKYRAWVCAEATGNYNETNQTFWGVIEEVKIVMYDTAPDETMAFGMKVPENIHITAKLNLSTNDSSQKQVHLYGLERDYLIKKDSFYTVMAVHARYSNLTVDENTTGKIEEINGTNGTSYIMHNNMELTLVGTLLNGSVFLGTYPRSLIFRNLSAAIGVADNGANERELVDIVNNSVMVNVDAAIEYHEGYVGEYTALNIPYIFGGFAAIVGVFVAIGWMRIGSMMLSMNQRKKEQGKEMLNRAIIGTIITAMVVFGWANLIGVLNWIMGG